MSSITQAKAEAQKLIRRYNQLQAEAKTADTVEAARKASEADKLVSQISALQLAITKLQAAGRKAITPASKGGVTTPTTGKRRTTTTPTNEIKRVAAEKSMLEDRIKGLEDAQSKTRAQIDQLNRAKTELTRLKKVAEKSAANVVQERRTNDEKLQQELAKLIDKKEAEHHALKKELETVRQQAQKDAEMLKIQRDAARAMMEKQKQLEKEQSFVSHRQRSSRGFLVMISGVAITSFLMGVLVTLLFVPSGQTEVTTSTKVSTNSADKKNTKLSATKEKERAEKQKMIKPMEEYRDHLFKGGRPGPLMVKLPNGTFKMGRKNTSIYQDERPQHEVTLKGFSISKYEITFEEYDLFAGATGRMLPIDEENWGRGKRPIINITWHDTVAYTKWLSKQTTHQYRLPSEREWEYAAKAGKDMIYSWGDRFENKKANCGICGNQWDMKQTTPVGSFKPNGFGIYDTIGNVREWTLSCYRPHYEGAPLTGNIWKWISEKECSKRVVRSSSFRSSSKSRELPITRRHGFSPTTKMDELGFRVVRVD
ncbi:SUMF1/EgtB/PvdO family nonheme iron enzyme [Candidatus Parabeggiatoa sp. HSG14]|uniref:formylglycine-generating enzyme family protein n=1 Tax=Candidatus Parabeggiatoa sp. HSG14 TaxID=3055593 RepID=UPI0025A75AE3|nr:SUMF1/EgtB/PvdO family nonheme iron enzyme [Thiotrichales bacterium HSG14]